jgi:hypothetical protein
MSELRIGDRVEVTEKNSGLKYRGVLVRNDLELANRAQKTGPWRDQTFVRFDNDIKEDVYRYWLKQGSFLYVRDHGKCFIQTIEYDRHMRIMSLRVSEDSGGYNIYTSKFNITTADITSILVYNLAYHTVAL